MTFEEYQTLAERTLPVKPALLEREQRLVLALGLAGEVGEAIDYLKKVEGHGHPLQQTRLAGELGDVLWYISGLASAYGLSLADVAHGNIVKLKARYPDGFTTEASLNRRGDD